MDTVLIWLSDNRDLLIVGVVVAVVGGVVLKGGTRLGRSLRTWFRTHTKDRRVAKKQKKEREQREKERRRYQRRFLASDITRAASPKTDAGQVTVGALLDTDWRFVHESVDEEFIDLYFLIGRNRQRRIPQGVEQPVLHAAQKFDSEAEWVDRASSNSQQIYPYGHLRVGIRVSLTPN